MGTLTVHLDKITNLTDKDRGLIARSDPYVVFHLEKSNAWFGNWGDRTSSVKDDTCNPKFDETYVYEKIPSLQDMTLKVNVYDSDWGRDESLGQCEFQLGDMNLSETPTSFSVVVDPKKDKGWLSRAAKIHLKLSFKTE